MSENVANVSMQKLGGGWGGEGGIIRNFRANDAKYFLCSHGVAVVWANVSGVRDYPGQAAFFLFWRWSLLDRGRKKKPSGADDDTVICSTFSFRRTENWQTWSEGCCGLFPGSVISINFYKTFL